MNGDEQIPEEQSSIIVIASIVCALLLMIVYWLSRPLVEKLQVGWIEFAAYSLIPMSATFIILYRSNWHQEIIGSARTCCLFLLSCAILSGVLIAIGILFYVLVYNANVVSAGFH